MFGREGMRLVLIGVAFFWCHHPAGQCPMTTSFCFPSKSTYLNVDTRQWTNFRHSGSGKRNFDEVRN